MAKIVQLRQDRPRAFTTAEKMIEELRTQIFKDGRTYKEIAFKTGVNATTVNNLASGKTRWPRPTTLFPLLATLGLSVQIVRKS
jgi:transcriptional regulator with XRE-family HTH domain